jgi:uncharacterized glyoxalase superfamily protein PhnB
MAVKPIPDGYQTLTPHIVVSDAAKAIDFYKKAFGAEEIARAGGPGGKIMHAVVRIGNSLLMLNDEFPDMGAKSPKAFGGTAVTLHVYVEDADKIWQRAVAAGATVHMPIADMFWGDRYGVVVDPFGHHWSIATHKEDVPEQEMMKRAAAAFGQK